jgi:hypothetical protein
MTSTPRAVVVPVVNRDEHGHFSGNNPGDPGLEGHVPLGMNPGMPVSTTELSLTRVLIP